MGSLSVFGNPEEIIISESGGIAKIRVPLLENEMISLVLKVVDNGEPRLVSYKRILIANHKST
ncbi:MAG: hypothetical protein HC906_04975 [Bacteroidales bacterium]|nr:hypothetical protein [Bacteroidales bacterium]